MRFSAAFLAMSLVVATTASANTIDVQFTAAAGTEYGGTGAAPDAGTIWNQLNFSGPGPGPVSLTNLVDSQGGATGAAISVSGYENQGVLDVNENPLLSSYIYTNDTGAPATVTGSFTISGLTGSSYDLYLYSQIGNLGQGSSTFTINAVSQTVTGGASGATATTIPTSDLGISYTVYSGLSPVSGVISGTWTDNGTLFAGVFNGFQLVSVPEPSAFLLISFASLGFIAKLRRARS
jgi:hypothetical protein